jgi:hypothetical protein
MHPDRFGLPLRAQLSATILEVPDELLLLRVDRDHRLTDRLERPHLGVDMLELRVAVGVAGALARLGIGLQAEPQASQQAADQLLASGEASFGQRRRQNALALTDPQQGCFGIATDRRLHQVSQGVQKPRLRLRRGLASSSPPTNSRAGRYGARLQVCQAATDGAPRKASRPRHRSYSAATSGARFTGSEQTPVSLVQESRKRIEPGCDDSDVDHPGKVDARAHWSRQFPDSFVAFFPPSRFISSDSVVQARPLTYIRPGYADRKSSVLHNRRALDLTSNGGLPIVVFISADCRLVYPARATLRTNGSVPLVLIRQRPHACQQPRRDRRGKV